MLALPLTGAKIPLRQAGQEDELNTNVATATRASGRIEHVLALVRAKVAAEERATLEAFVRGYYGQVDPEDLAERDAADLYGAALSHWNFARKRDPGQACVRVFNPTLEEHGWQSTHTIVEIVNDDMPFLVDTVTMEVNRHGLTLHLIIHPIIAVTRGGDGTQGGVTTDATQRALRESYIHVEVDRLSDVAQCEALAADMKRVLQDVRSAVRDWVPMQQRLLAIVEGLEGQPLPLPASELEEGRAFLRWLADNHFTLLGYRQHTLATVDGQDALKIVPASSLGILRDESGKELAHQLFGASAGSARLCPPARVAGHHQVHGALDRASAGLPRLHRGQAFRQ